MPNRCTLFAFLAIISVGLADDLADVLFGQFKSDYNVSYVSPAKEQHAFANFKDNLVRMAYYNTIEGGTAEYGITKYSDLSADEFSLAFLTGLLLPAEEERLPTRAVPDVQLPEHFDWRDYGAVTPVENQGQCGSCWAYSVNGNIEGVYKISTGSLISLSEQYLVDCDEDDLGCAGGWPETTIEWIKENGVAIDSQYPQTVDQLASTCKDDASLSKIRIKNGYSYNTGSEQDMKKSLYKYGPLGTAIHAQALQLYKSGIIGVPKYISTALPLCCSFDSCLDHAVLLVGFGKEPALLGSNEYWIVKNSWGENWGEKGYFKIISGKNKCGLASYTSGVEI